MARPELRFADARGVRIAYQAFGVGEHTIVAIPPLAQNIEVGWERPEVAAMLTRLASFSSYVHFDKRGTGASDRSRGVPVIDEHVDDLRAVMDAAGVEHAHLLGASEGGPMALLFAATYPDRVDSVVLAGSGVSTWRREDLDLQPEELVARLGEVAAQWGTSDSPWAERFAPTLVAADPTFVEWHRRYERLAATRDAMLDLMRYSMAVDASEVLPTLAVPVMALHRVDDPVVPIDNAREAVELVPDGRLVGLPGGDHFAYAGDVDAWVDEIERWVTGEVASTPVRDLLRPPPAGPPPSARRDDAVDRVDRHTGVPSARTDVAGRSEPARPLVHVLGRFAVHVDGEEVTVSSWGSRRARQLLKRLVVARGWPVTRDALCDVLWPDEPDRTKVAPRLSVELSRLRRVLGGGVVATRESVRLDLDAVDVDLERLHAARDDDAVVAAYVGDLLPEDADAAWSHGPRGEARSRFVAAARRTAAACLHGTSADPARTVGLARRLVDLDPFDDEAHRLLVTGLLELGEPTAAEQAHARWAGAMDQLGVTVPPLA